LIKRRGKLGLIKVKADFDEAKTWIQERLGKEQKVVIFKAKKYFHIFLKTTPNSIDIKS